MDNNMYNSPLCRRYASREMSKQFSPNTRYCTWRHLWVILAECQKELGLNITEHQIQQLRKHEKDLNYDAIRQIEKEIKHDVMANIHAYGEQCKDAKGIIHLGATSCYVTDNADIIIMRDALKIIKRKVVAVLSKLRTFAIQYKKMPTIGLTHLQPAQLVTVGKRACLWMQDLLMDLNDLEYIESTMKLLGSKGTTGTQASFMNLFHNDNEKVKKLELMIAKRLGFEEVYKVSGQTYSRKLDSRIINVLSGIAQSACKFSNDMRFLQSTGELEEPFGKKQVGSSAMAYKRNPIRSERIASLARFAIINTLNPAFTAASQWFERTLDDSANRRMSLPEMFMTVDAILNIFLNITADITVHSKVIEKHVAEQMPFMATENILMEAVAKGGDRQELHEKLREYSMQTIEKMRDTNVGNSLISKIANDSSFGIDEKRLGELLEPLNYTGRSAEQVDEFIEETVDPILKKWSQQELSAVETELDV